MKTKIFLCIFGALAITLFFFSFGRAQSKVDSKGPMITNSFAIEKGYYGYAWKIYIEAEDPTGDMYRSFQRRINQDGVNIFPIPSRSNHRININ
jgi:hypothetical protein